MGIKIDLLKRSIKNPLARFFISKIFKIEISNLLKPKIFIHQFDSESMKKDFFYEFRKKNPITKYAKPNKHYQTNHNLTDDSRFFSFKKKIEKFLNDEIKNEFFKNKTLGKFKIKNMWFTMMSQNQTHEIHNHPKSSLSGVYYLTESKNSGGLNILLPKNNLKKYKEIKETSYDDIELHNEKIKTILIDDLTFYPKKNQMIIFNSYIYHFVDKYTDTNDRISIAWDAIYIL